MALDFGSMFDNELNGLKGWYPGQDWSVEKQLPVATFTNITEAHYVAGKIVHVDRGLITDQPRFNLGLPEPTSLLTAALPFILFGSANDFDVAGANGNFTSATSTTIGEVFSNGNQVKAVAATQAAEMETTAFVIGEYFPGDLLTSEGTIETAASDADAVALGKFRKLAASDVDGSSGDVAKVVVGVVTGAQDLTQDSSPGTFDDSSAYNEQGVGMLRFHTWPQVVRFDATS